jgi:hypothetical protein
MMCTWSPTSRILLSFTRAFRHVLSAANGTLLVGSNEPLPDDLEAALRRARSARVREYLGAAVGDDVLSTLRDLRPVRNPPRPPRSRLNEDLYPRDEFRLR